MPRDMENYRQRKRKQYSKNVEKERERKNKYNRENKQRVSDLYKISYSKNKEKYLCRSKLKYAVKKWLLERPNQCSVCLCTCKPDWHHHDYSKPYEVVWLCKLCHLTQHRWARKSEYWYW